MHSGSNNNDNYNFNYSRECNFLGKTMNMKCSAPMNEK